MSSVSFFLPLEVPQPERALALLANKHRKADLLGIEQVPLRDVTHARSETEHLWALRLTEQVQSNRYTYISVFKFCLKMHSHLGAPGLSPGTP